MASIAQLRFSPIDEPFLGTEVSAAAAGGMVLLSLAMVLIPGPNMIYLLSRSIGQGRAAGLISLAGTGVGFMTYMTMANLGLAVAFVTLPWLFIGLKAAGVLYLLCLAWQALVPGTRGAFAVRHLRRDSAAKLFGMGLATNLLNPKTAAMYLALIPQFVDSANGSTVVQGFVLGSVQIVVSMTVNATLVAAAGTVAGFFAARPGWANWQRRATGALLGAVAILLAIEVPHRIDDSL